MSLDDVAIHKYPKRGKCAKSCFANGWHRVGLVPFVSILDGGAPGDSCREMCLECERMFKHSVFVIRNQPRSLVTP